MLCGGRGGEVGKESLLCSRPLLSSGNLGEVNVEKETPNSLVWTWMPFESFGFTAIFINIVWSHIMP